MPLHGYQLERPTIVDNSRYLCFGIAVLIGITVLGCRANRSDDSQASTTRLKDSHEVIETSTEKILTRPNRNHVVQGVSFRPGITATRAHANPDSFFAPIETPEFAKNPSFDNSPYQKQEQTSRAFFASRYAFLRTGIDHYKDIARDSAEQKDNAEKFMDDVLRKELFFERAFEWDELYDRGHALIATDPRNADPLLLGYAGLCAKQSYQFGSAARLFAYSIENFQSSNYPWRHVVRVHYWLTEMVLRMNVDEYARDIVRQNCIKAMTYWLTSDLRATSSEHQQVVYQVMIFFDVLSEHGVDSWWGDDKRTIPELSIAPILVGETKNLRGFPAYLQNMIAGDYYLKLAVSWRGREKMADVPPENRSKFEENLNRARGYYLKAIEINSDFPEAYGRMCDIGRLTNYEEMEHWFEKAVEAQFDYLPAYRLMISGLKPNWWGTTERMLSFGRRCAATNRYDTFVPYYLVQSVFEISSQVDAAAYFDEVSEVLTKLAENANDERGIFTQSGYRTMLACQAFHSGNFAQADNIFRSLGDKIPAQEFAMASQGCDVHNFVGMVSAMNSERREQARPIYPLFFYETNDLEWLADAKDAVANVDVDKVPQHERAFWLSAQRLLNLYRNINSGEWIELPFNDPEVRLWRYPNRGNWQETEEGIQLGYDRQTSASIPFIPDRPLVFECDVEFIDSYGDDNSAGIGIGWNQLAPEHGRSVTINPLQNFIRLAGAVPDAPNREVNWEFKPDKNRITFIAFPGYYQIQLNGETIFSQADDRFHFDAGPIVIRTSERSRGGGVVRFSNARIRGWNHGLPPADRNLATALKYYERILDQDQTCVNAWLQKGVCHLRLQQFDDAATCFLAAKDHGANPLLVKLYLGEIHESKGEWKEAVEAYRAAMPTKEGIDQFWAAENQNMDRFYSVIKLRFQSGYRGKYIAKLGWILAFAPDPAIRNVKEAEEAASQAVLFLPRSDHWVVTRIKAAAWSEKGNFPQALKELSNLSVPADQLESLQAQQQAYLNLKQFSIESGDQVLGFPKPE